MFGIAKKAASEEQTGCFCGFGFFMLVQNGYVWPPYAALASMDGPHNVVSLCSLLFELVSVTLLLSFVLVILFHYLDVIRRGHRTSYPSFFSIRLDICRKDIQVFSSLKFIPIGHLVWILPVASSFAVNTT